MIAVAVVADEVLAAVAEGHVLCIEVQCAQGYPPGRKEFLGVGEGSTQMLAKDMHALSTLPLPIVLLTTTATGT